MRDDIHVLHSIEGLSVARRGDDLLLQTSERKNVRDNIHVLGSIEGLSVARRGEDVLLQTSEKK